jgi:hypothetical protein
MFYCNFTIGLGVDPKVHPGFEFFSPEIPLLALTYKLPVLLETP